MKRPSAGFIISMTAIFGICFFFLIGPISLVIQTQVAKRDSRKMIEQGATLAEMKEGFVYGSYKTFKGIENLPIDVRNEVPDSISPDATFHHFGMEGWPSYWSFVVVTGEDGRITWGMVRKRP